MTIQDSDVWDISYISAHAVQTQILTSLKTDNSTKYRPVYAYMILCPKEENKKQISVKQ